jgi:hypothetical protein
MVFSAIGGVVAPADPMLDPPLPANGMPTLPALQYVFCVFIPTAGGRQRLQSHVVGAQEHHSWRPPRMRYSTLVRPHLPLATACNNHHRTPAHLESLEPRERERGRGATGWTPGWGSSEFDGPSWSWRVAAELDHSYTASPERRATARA